ncbi:DUF3343 domain-containing protein [Sedimentibacter sp. zth1]|uniref:putative Se/S carrier-like protein n=1 Tax=Sedimentibacter sp. zth1 TaxID=2816908 RepID=UPI001A92E5F6|nr:putative Se/S carrier-like protein [Sedimentibacter sp. zth1]QSX06429.1 DUF3343 domain-containing protein [Sedimentibacter sp. zth1]
MEHYVITYKYGNFTMAAYSRLQSLNINNIKLAPVPFAIKTECDLCIIVNDYNTLLIVLNESTKYPVDNVYMATKMTGNLVYRLLDF